jgi:pyridoxal 5'-phosphate synthase pdxT subunit
MKIGVLAVQGNYDMHSDILEQLGIDPILVRYPNQLDSLEGLVIPGGESTTMTKLMNRIDFFSPIKSFANYYPVLGTCAGLILMSEKVVDTELDTLGLLDIQIERNGYGRQIYSNTIDVDVDLNNINYSLPASFIRAPRIISYGQSVNVLAMYDDTPIVVKNNRHMGISFHPELDNISILHEYIFLNGKADK